LQEIGNIDFENIDFEGVDFEGVDLGTFKGFGDMDFSPTNLDGLFGGLNYDANYDFKKYYFNPSINLQTEIGFKNLYFSSASLGVMKDIDLSFKLETSKRQNDWKLFILDFSMMKGIWKDLKNIFTAFTNKCSGCAIDRGTLNSWLIGLITSSIELPVFELPRLNDLKYTFQITVPSSIEIPSTTKISDENDEVGFDYKNKFSWENLWQFILPKTMASEDKGDSQQEQISLEFKVPELIPKAPELGTEWKILLDLVELPRAFFDFLCIIRLGFSPIP